MEEQGRLYNTMKSLNISTLELHRVLSDVGIDITKRTLHRYLVQDLNNCMDDRVGKVVRYLIKNKKEIKNNLINIL